MKQRMPDVAVAEPVAKTIAVRLEKPLAERFHKVVVASKRTKTSIVEECLVEWLPKIEKQYSRAA